jgi:hypothetical protein
MIGFGAKRRSQISGVVHPSSCHILGGRVPAGPDAQAGRPVICITEQLHQATSAGV